MNNFLNVAIAGAKKSGEAVSASYLRGDFEVSLKSDSSHQTNADLESERLLVSFINEAFPTHRIKSEEGGEVVPNHSQYQWLIDPLDGTDNFILGIPYFSVSLCLCKEDKPLLSVVFNPITKELFTAERGKGAKLNGLDITPSAVTELSKSRVFMIPTLHTKHKATTRQVTTEVYARCKRLLDTWAPSLDWCLVACGKAEGIVALGDSPPLSDGGMLAGMIILSEAGGVITDLNDQEIDLGNSQCFIGSSNSSIQNALIQLARPI